MNPWLIAAPPALAAAAAGIAAYGAVYPRSQLFGSTICRTNSPRKLALTFDDGPNPAITPKLLDLLDRFEARATFFVIGKHARDCPELLGKPPPAAMSSAITPMPTPIFFGSSPIASPSNFVAAISQSKQPPARCLDGFVRLLDFAIPGSFPPLANSVSVS